MNSACGRPSAHHPAIEAQKIAGWANLVPSSTRRKGSSPTIWIAWASRSGRTRATVSRMSGVWLPWPGNRIAVVIVVKLTPAPAGELHRVGRFPPLGGPQVVMRPGGLTLSTVWVP